MDFWTQRSRALLLCVAGFCMVCYCYMQEDLSCVLGWDLCVTSLYRDRHPVHLLMRSVELDRSTATKMNVRGANRPYTGRLDFEVVRDQPRAVPGTWHKD
jgi:hypothetical protein